MGFDIWELVCAKPRLAMLLFFFLSSLRGTLSTIHTGQTPPYGLMVQPDKIEFYVYPKPISPMALFTTQTPLN